MNIVNNVKIAGVDYEVKIEDSIDNGTNLLYGQIQYNDFTITLTNYPSNNIQRKEQTLLHEILHGIIHNYNIDVDEDKEESLVESLTTGLYQVIKDNPELFNMRS